MSNYVVFLDILVIWLFGKLRQDKRTSGMQTLWPPSDY